MKLRLSVGIAAAEREKNKTLKKAKAAHLGGVTKATLEAKKAWRDELSGAFQSKRLPNTIATEIYGKTSWNPAGMIYSRAPKLMQSFSKGATIRAQKASYLAVKTDECPRVGTDGKAIRFPSKNDKGNWNEAKYGPLRFVKKRNGDAMLVVNTVRVGKNGRIRGLTKSKATKTMGERTTLNGRATVVMANLKKVVTLRPRINPAAAAKAAGDKIPHYILQKLYEA